MAYMTIGELGQGISWMRKKAVAPSTPIAVAHAGPLEEQIRTLQEQCTSIRRKITQIPSGWKATPEMRAQRQTLTSQLQMLMQKINELQKKLAAEKKKIADEQRRAEAAAAREAQAKRRAGPVHQSALTVKRAVHGSALPIYAKREINIILGKVMRGV